MSNKVILVDTSVWILALRKAPLAPVKDEVDHLLAENRVVIVPMIRLELLGGTKSANEFERLRSLVSVSK
jgi:predicted nucleic acid-binding protein